MGSTLSSLTTHIAAYPWELGLLSGQADCQSESDQCEAHRGAKFGIGTTISGPERAEHHSC